jgi:hypothetical protein
MIATSGNGEHPEKMTRTIVLLAPNTFLRPIWAAPGSTMQQDRQREQAAGAEPPRLVRPVVAFSRWRGRRLEQPGTLITADIR